APIVTALSASSGFATGGESITIYGVNLSTATGVVFVDAASSRVIPATSFTVNDDGTLTVVVPPFVGVPPSGGVTVDIQVQTPNGISAPRAIDRFVYTPAGAVPTITSLSNTSGTTAAGGSTAGGAL